MREPAQHPYVFALAVWNAHARWRGFVYRKPAPVSTLMQNALPFDGNHSVPSGFRQSGHDRAAITSGLRHPFPSIT